MANVDISGLPISKELDYVGSSMGGNYTFGTAVAMHLPNVTLGMGPIIHGFDRTVTITSTTELSFDIAATSQTPRRGRSGTKEGG